MRMSLEYDNPWYTPFCTSPKVFKRENVPVVKTECGRGMIVKVYDKHYDYLVDGKVITQRCGSSMSVMKRLLLQIPGRD